MYERCISCSIVWTRMRVPGSCWASSGMVHLDVEVHDVLRVLLDILPARADGLAHQDGEQRVCRCRVLDRDLLQEPPGRIEGRLPKFVRVHLAQAFVTLNREPLLSDSLQEFLLFALRIRVVYLLALANLVQRRLPNVDIARVNHWPHVPKEECEKQSSYVLSIYVAIRECSHLVIPNFREIEFLADASSNCRDQRADLLVLQHLVEPCLLNIQDFSSEREDCLEFAPTTRLATPARARSFYDEDF